MNAKNLFILLSFSLTLTLVPAHADQKKIDDLGIMEKNVKRSYQTKNFCSGIAEEMMGQLEAKNKEKFARIEEFRQQIVELNTYDSVINDVSAIKDRYLDSLSDISSGKNDTKNKDAQLDDMKSVIRHGLILNALTDLLEHQDGDSKRPEVLTMNDLCKENESKAICKKSTTGFDTKGVTKKKFFFGEEVHKLDATLSNFEKTAAKLPANQQADLKKEVQKIIQDIPKDISPEVILATLMEQAPKTAQLISNPIAQESLKECLRDKADKKSLEACNQILTNPEDRKALIEAFNRESLSVASKFKSYNTVVQAAVESNKSDLEKKLDHFDASSKTSVVKTKESIIETSKLLNAAAQSLSGLDTASKSSVYGDQTKRDVAAEENTFVEQVVLNDIENFFYMRPLEDMSSAAAIAETRKKQKTAMINARNDAATFKSTCSFETSSKNSPDDIQKINTCKALIEKSLPQIKALKATHAQKIKDLQQKVKQLSNEGDFSATENLKSYLAEKYLCLCEDDKKKIKTSYEDSLVMGANSDCQTQFMTLSKIEGLSASGNFIAKVLYAHEVKVPLDTDGKCSFPEEKLKVFTDTCKNNSSLATEFPGVCKAVANEYVPKKRDEAKEEKKWIEYNKKNFITYDSETNQYVSSPKKSNLRIIGEGILPSVPMMLPALFGNFQMKQNINALTEQALWIEQAQYSQTYYMDNAPWMFGMNYFNNPFLQFGSAVGSTSTSLTPTTIDSSAGFNFGL